MTQNTPDEGRMARLESLCERIHDHVVGTPSTAGLTTRVAKVEQRQGMFMKGFWLVISSLTGIVVWLFKGKA